MLLLALMYKNTWAQLPQLLKTLTICELALLFKFKLGGVGPLNVEFKLDRIVWRKSKRTMSFSFINWTLLSLRDIL